MKARARGTATQRPSFQPRLLGWFVAMTIVLAAVVVLSSQRNGPMLQSEAEKAASDTSIVTTGSTVNQGSGISAEPLIQSVQIDRMPRTLASEVGYSDLIVEAIVAELGPPQFNTTTGQMPGLAQSDDPSLEIDEGWSIYTPARFDVTHVYKGDPVTTHIVAELMGGEMPDGNKLVVEGVSYSELQIGQTVMLFSAREYEPVMYSDLYFLRRGSVRTLALMDQGHHPEFRQIGAICIYNGSQAQCIEDMFSMPVTDLRSQIDALVP